MNYLQVGIDDAIDKKASTAHNSLKIAKSEIERLRKSLSRCLKEAEEWMDEARGCKPDDVMGYDGWADEARWLLGPNA